MDWDCCFIDLSQIRVMANEWGRRLEMQGSLRWSEALQHLCSRLLNTIYSYWGDRCCGRLYGRLTYAWFHTQFDLRLMISSLFCLLFFYMSALSLALFNTPQVRAFNVFSCRCKYAAGCCNITKRHFMDTKYEESAVFVEGKDGALTCDLGSQCLSVVTQSKFLMIIRRMQPLDWITAFCTSVKGHFWSWKS